MNDIEKVQRLSISLLKKYIDICEANNLRYYFTGGALIGVLRHQGFIPWDDDIDVGMPRADFEKFIKILKSDMPVGYGVCDRYTNPNWHFLMFQFVDVESEIEIDLAQKKRKAHVWIDVFPLDGLPANSLCRWVCIKKILYYRYLIQLLHVSTQVDSHRKRPFIEKAILWFGRVIPLNKLINTNKVLDRFENMLRKTDFDKSKYAGNMLGRYREREAVPTKYFGVPKKGVFENIEVNIPAMSHELQTALYGDYMQLPPEEERVAHNVKIIKCRER